MPEFNRAELHAGPKIFVPHRNFPDGAAVGFIIRERRPRRPPFPCIKGEGAPNDKMRIATHPPWGRANKTWI